MDASTLALIVVGALTAFGTLALAGVGAWALQHSHKLATETAELARVAGELLSRNERQLEQSERLVSAAIQQASAAREQATVSRQLLEQDRDLVQAAIEQSRATLVQTQAIQLQARVMAAAFCPNVKVIGIEKKNGVPGPAAVINQGPGTAHRCVVAHDQRPGHWVGASEPLDLVSGRDVYRLDLNMLANSAMEILEDIWNDGSSTTASVCRDQLGTCYRFIQSLGLIRTETYTPGSTEDPPKWTRLLLQP